MAESIQAFVEKIRTEGVEAGKAQADQLLGEAKQQAEEIIAQAGQEKDNILAQAKRDADNMLARAKDELRLAARDTVMRLRDALNLALKQVLGHGVESNLEDTEFIGQLLHEIISQFAQADLEGERTFEINVRPEMRDKLINWALAELGRESIGQKHVSTDLKGTLRQAGFEYNATGATVEVTVESVVERLSELVSPKLREILNQALAEGAE